MQFDKDMPQTGWIPLVATRVAGAFKTMEIQWVYEDCPKGWRCHVFPATYRPIANVSYNLRSIVVHVGRARSGHYVACARDDRYGWLNYDDSATPVRVDDEAVLKQCAYLLLYERIWEHSKAENCREERALHWWLQCDLKVHVMPFRISSVTGQSHNDIWTGQPTQSLMLLSNASRPFNIFWDWVPSGHVASECCNEASA